MDPPRDKIQGLSLNGYDTFYDTTCAKPRSCITVSSGFKGLLLVNYLEGDNVAIKVNFETHGHKDEIFLMSSYLLFGEKSPLSEKKTTFIEICSEGNKKLVFGCDTNVHDTAWGSTDCNKCVMSFLKTYLCSIYIFLIRAMNLFL